MIDEEKVLTLIKMQGPVLPTQVAKIIGKDTLVASAYLSELTDSKKVRISHTKVGGGSPVYYLQGQEPNLQDLYKYLNEREKEAYDLLKDKKILKDDAQAPAIRVALRSIKDFSVPLNVSHEEKTELFWKWYLLTNDEATNFIQQALEGIKPIEPVVQRKLEHVQKLPEIKKDEAEVIKKIEDNERKQLEEEKKSVEEEKRKLSDEKRRFEEEERQVKRQRLEEERRFKEKEKMLEEEKQRLLREHERKIQEEQKKLVQGQKEQEDPFFSQIKLYLDSKKIELINYQVIKKKKEIDLIVRVPSVIGKLDYLCKAKRKRKISDSDINALFVEGQIKKIPVLFLTTGVLSKKAQEKLANEFKGLTVDRLE